MSWESKNMITLIDPSFDTFIELHNGEINKKVILNTTYLSATFLSNPIKKREEALRYLKLYEKIWEIIKSKKEYKHIPESDMLYF